MLFVESRQLACRRSSMLHLLVIRVVGTSEIEIKSGSLPFKLDEQPVSYSKTGESCCDLRAFLKARNGMPRDPSLELAHDASWLKAFPQAQA